jgi:hypothetical protein
LLVDVGEVKIDKFYGLEAKFIACGLSYVFQ